MIEGIFGKKNENKAPSVPVKTASVSSASNNVSQANLAQPMQASHNVSAASFQSVVEEAAIIFASGEEAAAAEMLMRFLMETKGNAGQRVWFMLLDVFHAMGKRSDFDKLALNYASKFGTSPPSWDNLGQSLVSDNQSSGSSGAGKLNGSDNVLILEGVLRGDMSSRFKPFVTAAKAQKTCKMDISRLRVEQSDPLCITQLFGVMKDMRKFKVAATLMGENHVARWLLTKVEEAKNTKNTAYQTYWLLYLEILQWRGVKQDFEDLSFEYTITFEESGPDFRDNEVMTIEKGIEVEEVDSGSAEVIEIQGEITQNMLNKLIDNITASIGNRGFAKVDFNGVLRMDFSTAGSFSSSLQVLNCPPEKLIILGASEPIVALMDVVGLSAMVSFVPRKR